MCNRIQPQNTDLVYPIFMIILYWNQDRFHDHLVLDNSALKLPKEFVVHSLRHTILTRLGEPGTDAFTIMRIAGQDSVTISQRYFHPTPEGIERVFERLQSLNDENARIAEMEIRAEGGESRELPTISATAKKRRTLKSSQVLDIKRAGP